MIGSIQAGRFVGKHLAAVFLTLAVGLGLGLGSFPSLGDELPKDPRAIDRLEAISLEQARSLVQSVNGGALHLDGLTALPAAAARPKQLPAR